LLFNCASEYTNRKLHEDQKDLVLKYAHQPLILADDVPYTGYRHKYYKEKTQKL